MRNTTINIEQNAFFPVQEESREKSFFPFFLLPYIRQEEEERRRIEE